MVFSTFYIVGISVRTTNESGQSAKDIPQLWQRFFAENIVEKIPNKLDATVYTVYTDYESDYTQPYTTVIGCKVANLNEVPKGMVGISVPGGTFTKFTAKGDIHKGAVYHEWLKIWKTPLSRKYTADFEVYGEKAQNPQAAEVDIFIAVQ